jgi:hypothetical protein
MSATVVRLPSVPDGTSHTRRLVAIAGGRRAAARRRAATIAAVAALAVVMFLLGALVGSRSGEASPEAPAVVGTATVTPGGTLWDIAVTHAPAGTDPRAYLEEIQRLNGLRGEVAPWTVVLLPAP